MDNIILNKYFTLNAVLVLVSATAYSKTDNNRSSGQAKLC